MRTGRQFSIQANEFETGALGVPVGTLTVADATDLPDPDEITSAARQGRYRLVTLATSVPAAIPGFMHVGTVAAYAAPIAVVCARLPTSRHFHTVPLEERHWGVVTEIQGRKVTQFKIIEGRVPSANELRRLIDEPVHRAMFRRAATRHWADYLIGPKTVKLPLQALIELPPAEDEA